MKTPDILLSASRQYQHNDCSGFVAGFEYEETCRIVAGLSAKLRELVEAAEWRDEVSEARRYCYWRKKEDYYPNDRRRSRWTESLWHATQLLDDAFAAYQAALKAAKEG